MKLMISQKIDYGSQIQLAISDITSTTSELDKVPQQ